jgi:hypothetical protein
LLTIPYDLVFVHDTISKELVVVVVVVVVSPKKFGISSMIPIVSVATIREKQFCHFTYTHQYQSSFLSFHQ